jgi:hypothetical protein
MSRFHTRLLEEVTFGTLTVDGLRRAKWKVRAFAAFVLIGPQVLRVITSRDHSISNDAVNIVLVALGAYAILETLILAPPWLTKPAGNLIISYACAVIAGLNAYEDFVPSTEFYKAAAAIVPVLFLTFVLERKQEYHSTDNVASRLIVVSNALGLMWAGKACFNVLAFDDTKHARTLDVIFPIVFTVVSMTLSLVSPPRARQIGE